MPHARLRALARLTAAGLNAGLIVAPVLPAINDSVEQLDALLSAAKAANARFAHPAPLRLYSSIRDHFLPVIDQHFPELAEKYRAAYRGFGNAPRPYAAALGRRFRRVALRYGIASGPQLPSPAPRKQLGFWPEK